MLYRANSGGSGKQGQQQPYDCCSGAQKQQQLLAGKQGQQQPYDCCSGAQKQQQLLAGK